MSCSRSPLACLSRLWSFSATFCTAFGSSGLSLGSGTAPGPLFAPFWAHFGPFWGYFLRNSGVDFEAVLILLLIVAAFGFCSWSGCLGICFGNRVGFVGFGGEREEKRSDIKRKEKTKTREERRAEQSRKEERGEEK